ncbi:MAG: nucleoside hydrolase [Clostridia bacterium]|nr:nucleoside hydrolase [Clostridia bacterium]
MTEEQYIKNLNVPRGTIDAVLDTDAYNEIDDQYAIAYMLFCQDKINIKAIYAAPFFAKHVVNKKADSPKEGMEKSYKEILHILDLANMWQMGKRVMRGSTDYLKSHKEPQPSEVAEDLVRLARLYSPQKPLYVITIGCLTNLASALLMAPEISENIVVVCMCGNGSDWGTPYEFNLNQDFTASKIVFNSGAPIVQVPGMGVTSELRVTKPELEYWLLGKNKLCDYIAGYTISEAESYAKGRPWSRVLWDVPAVAWLMDDEERFMKSRLVSLPGYIKQNQYENRLIRYVYWVDRDNIFEELVKRLTAFDGI